MQVACPICWHSVVTAVVCQSCGLTQCLEYEGPRCIACGGPCRLSTCPALDAAVPEEQPAAAGALQS